jgi:hypothetical protein
MTSLLSLPAQFTQHRHSAVSPREPRTAVKGDLGGAIGQTALSVLYGLAIILLYFLSAGSDAVFVYQGF